MLSFSEEQISYGYQKYSSTDLSPKITVLLTAEELYEVSNISAEYRSPGQ